MPVTVYRAGMIGGHSRTGAGNSRDLIWCWLRGIIQVGAASETNDPLDIAPVDYVSRALVHLSRQPASLGKTFHLSNPRPIPSSVLFDVIDALGYSLRRLSHAEWKREILAAIEGPAGNALAPFLPYFAQQKRAEDAPLRPVSQVDHRNTRSGLAGSGIECPAVDAEVLRRYIQYFVETGILEAPPGAVHAFRLSPSGPREETVVGAISS
jgi:thioester reductase-like protein